MHPDELRGRVLLGELGLDGQVRPVRGVLPAALTVRCAGVEHVVVPSANLAEAQLLPGSALRMVEDVHGHASPFGKTEVGRRCHSGSDDRR